MTLIPGPPLSGESVGLLERGDWLKVVSTCPFEDLQVGQVGQFIAPSTSGGVSNCIVTTINPKFGFNPRRFVFLARPGVEYPHDGGEMPEFLRGVEVSVSFGGEWTSGVAAEWWTEDEWRAVTSWSIPAPEAAKADDWVEWTGGENPVPGAMVEVKMRLDAGCPRVEPGALSDGYRWTHLNSSDHLGSGDIIAYRVVSPAPEAAREEGEEPAAWAVAAEDAAAEAYASFIGDPDGRDDTRAAKVAAAQAIERHAVAALRPQAPATAPSDVDGAVEALDFGSLSDTLERNPRWVETDQDMVWTALNHIRGDYEDADEDCAEQVIERLLHIIRRQNTALTEAREQARLDGEALGPFAEAAGIKLCGKWRDDEKVWRTDAAHGLTFGHLRAAAARLAARTGGA